MPLPLVSRVPSTARSLFMLDEQEQTPPPSRCYPSIASYTLLEHLGAGNSGSNVFSAEDSSNPSEPVAIKVHRGGHMAYMVPRFVREADITCELGKNPHPNIT